MGKGHLLYDFMCQKLALIVKKRSKKTHRKAEKTPITT